MFHSLGQGDLPGTTSRAADRGTMAVCNIGSAKNVDQNVNLFLFRQVQNHELSLKVLASFVVNWKNPKTRFPE